MKVLKFIAIAVAAVFGLLLIFGMTMSPEKSRLYDKQAQAEKMCDNMMSDSSLGTERRMTRDICDKLKAQIAEEIRRTK